MTWGRAAACRLENPRRLGVEVDCGTGAAMGGLMSVLAASGGHPTLPSPSEAGGLQTHYPISTARRIMAACRFSP